MDGEQKFGQKLRLFFVRSLKKKIELVGTSTTPNNDDQPNNLQAGTKR
jgi:hypothetical protein